MATKLTVLMLLCCSSVLAFQPARRGQLAYKSCRAVQRDDPLQQMTSSFELPGAEIKNLAIADPRISINPSGLIFLLPAIFMSIEPAFADSSYGILAGRTASMLHPITNFALFATSIYSAYLGLQWRRLRDLSEEIKGLGASLPKLATITARFPLSDLSSELNSQLTALSASDDADKSGKEALIRKDLATIRSTADLDSKYLELTTARKTLQSSNLKDKHHLTGSILLGAGVTVSILGAFNTYMRAGRLFPGPHLYAGMAITILWAGKFKHKYENISAFCLQASDS